MRYFALAALLGLFGCRQTSTLEEQQSMTMLPAGPSRVSVSADPSPGAAADPGGVVRKPVAGQGQLMTGSAMIWEYDAVPMVQLVGARARREGTVEDALRDALNEWGAQGWELVMVSGDTYIFKRPGSGF